MGIHKKGRISKLGIYSILVYAIVVSACPPTSIFEAVELPFYTYSQGAIGSVDEQFFVIQSEEEFQATYGISSNGFNFEDEMLIAAYKGQLYNGGYGYDIISILEEENRLLVTIQFTACSPCTRNLTSPYHIVATSSSEKEVIFAEITGTGEEYFQRDLAFYTVQNPSKSVNEISYFAIKSEEEYVGLTGGSSNGFDFSNEMILAAYLGPRSNGGFGWEITKIVETQNEVVAVVEFTSCGNACTRTFSYPVDAVATTNIDKPVYFIQVVIE